MKATLFTLAAINLATCYSQTPDSANPGESEKERTKSNIPDPAPRFEIEIPIPEEDELDIFVLKAVKVKSEDRHFTFDHEKFERLKDKPFTWKEGGILSSYEGKNFTTKFGIQYDARNKGVSFLNISF